MSERLVVAVGVDAGQLEITVQEQPGDPLGDLRLSLAPTDAAQVFRPRFCSHVPLPATTIGERYDKSRGIQQHPGAGFVAR